jgi:cellobiose phosphorylase
MLRVTLENLLGVTVEGGTELVVAPAIPDTWSGFTVEHRRPDGTRYTICVRCDGGAAVVRSATLDGASLPLAGGRVVAPLATDGQAHTLAVTLTSSTGATAGAAA